MVFFLHFKIYSLSNNILSGMKELVDKKFVHRDLKPENIFINNGIYKVADYGFA